MQKKTSVQRLRPLQRFTLAFFKRPRLTAVLALAVFVFGVASYTTLMKREGFPQMNIPYAVGRVGYFANDPAKVDSDVIKPLAAYLVEQPDVKSVTATSHDNYGVVFLQFKDGTNVADTTKLYSNTITKNHIIPDSAQLAIDAAKMGYTARGDDAVIAFYKPNDTSAATESLITSAEDFVRYMREKNITGIDTISLIQPVESVTNPLSGEVFTAQTSFERYGERVNNKTTFYHAVAVGVSAKDNVDMVALDDSLQNAIDDYSAKNSGTHKASISASYAGEIKQQISELQRTLLEGLLAVLIVGSLVIAIRASFITVLSMIFVVVSTFGLLHVIGYSLNTIVLFSIILALALIVDDTIIMVEAIDKERRVRHKHRNEIITTAVKKVGKAMISATTVAALSFTPLLFVGGVIGQFVRAVPITIISALVISLFAALIVIPLLARYIMLGKKQLSTNHRPNVIARVEERFAETVARPMTWARGRRGREMFVGATAIMVSLIFLVAGIGFATKVKFNIFPPTKDTNRIAVNLEFPPQTTISKAEAITDAATVRIANVLGSNFVSTGNYGDTDASHAWFDINLIDYSKRSVTASTLAENLKKDFSGFAVATLTARTIDVGPPPSNFEARVVVKDSSENSRRLAEAIATYLKTTNITRIDGSKVNFTTVKISDSTVVERSGKDAYVAVTAVFSEDDTTNQIILTKAAVQKEFTAEKMKTYGLETKDLVFDFSQEGDNQQSFKTMLIAFPVLLLIIYVVLALEFRSLLQPLIIFLAIPFSFFGIALGLYLTNNAFSFFAMLGFFALIGLSIKNTILLTDYANQARQEGMGAVDAAHAALAQRFRPLLATSLTAVVSLVPLALTSPFWQSLSVVLIFGLLSSTLQVIVIFPYFYIGSEFLRNIGKQNKRLSVR